MTAFGSFLHRLRILRGYESVADFLRERTIPFTANYYRDVEAGRKKLSVEAAVTLHEALELDDAETTDYFWHYFRDVLPLGLHEALLGKRTLVAEGSLTDLNHRNGDDAELRRRALALARYQREFVADDRVAALFDAHFDLLPVMTFVYMVERAGEAEVARVCERIGVTWDERAHEFLAEICSVEDDADGRWYVRRAPVLRMPNDDAGTALKDRFALHETARSIGRPSSGELFPPGGTYRHSMMVALPASALERIQRRLADLVTEIEVAANTGGQLDNPDCTPYFVEVVISGRPDYNGRSAT